MSAPSQKRRPRPQRVVWELIDPLDGMLLLRVDSPYGDTPAKRASHSRRIRAAPKAFHGFGRPDGKTIGVRTLKTRTRLIY